MPNLNDMPEPFKKALMAALIRVGTKPPTDDDPSDESPWLMMDALRGHEADTRRAATTEEAQRLVALSGPCRFKPGDVVQWNPDLHLSHYVFPKLGVACVVTQVFDQPMHNLSDTSGSEVAARNDMAIAFMRDDDDGKPVMLEYTYDSRRFEYAEKNADKKVRRVSRA